jgi:rare lipoprotein A
MRLSFVHDVGIPARSLLAILMAGSILISCGGKKPPMPKEPGKQKATQKPYTVLGKRYEPLKTHVGFTQEGVASWYGKDFHGKKTSNGEIYDMHAMTAAHKTLPLGVFVKVRNKENGQETLVRVNDRGPFVKNRIIDLSYAAAKKLGVDIKGTAPVRIEALGYRASGASGENYKEPETYDSGNYSVQVGAFKDQQNAKRLSEDMKKFHGYSEVKTATVNGELYYRVQVGKYTSLKAAEDAEGSFSDHGYPGSFVVSLD